MQELNSCEVGQVAGGDSKEHEEHEEGSIKDYQWLLWPVVGILTTLVTVCYCGIRIIRSFRSDELNSAPDQNFELKALKKK
jgi:hypothetical protein